MEITGTMFVKLKKKKDLKALYFSDFGPHHDGFFFGGNPSF